MAACTAPEKYYKIDPAKNGGVGGLTKKRALSDGGPLSTYACGKCINCRLNHSREWGLRCMHEDQLAAGPGSFVTLTYDDANLPDDWCLDYRHFQLFMHKLRKAIAGAGRFFMSAEYGEDNGRPHYHAILFNCFFEDRVFFRRIDGIDYYISPQLSKLWGKGFCLIGDITINSAMYVARYNLKKITGADAGSAYQWLLPDGEIVDRPPPFSRSSNRPGIGYDWFQRYWQDCFPADYLVWKGKRFPVPRYYTKLYERLDEWSAEQVKMRRAAAMNDRRDHPDFTSRRLRDKNELARLNSTSRRELK